MRDFKHKSVSISIRYDNNGMVYYGILRIAGHIVAATADWDTEGEAEQEAVELAEKLFKEICYD